MSRIKIRNSSLTLLGTLTDVLSASRMERINSDNTLAFTVPLNSATTALLVGGSVAELDGDYFDLVYYQKGQTSTGELVASAECEHVSYRLNNSDYDMEFFTQTGTPAAILAEILTGTGFTVGTVQPTASVTYSAQEKKSRRQLLMEFVAYVEAEVDFDQFEISILTQRGSVTPVNLTESRDLEVINKTYNAREKDKSGNPMVSYACSLIRPVSVALGDVVTLDYAAVDIDVSLRVVSITTNPYNAYETSFEIGNFISGLADEMYRIETSTLVKGKTYYGARISPEFGFESIRSDKLARGVFNADQFALQSGDGSGNSWVNRMYFDPVTGMYIFDGTLSATTIEALKAEIDVVISNTVIVNNLTAQKGYIAELTVDQLDTSDKVQRYLKGFTSPTNDITFDTDHIHSAGNLFGAYIVGDVVTITGCVSHTGNNKSAIVTNASAGVVSFAAATYTAGAESAAITFKDTSDVYYIRINNQVVEWVEAKYSTAAPVQCRNRANTLLYWVDGTFTGVTEAVTAFPVMQYAYNEYVKRKDWFKTDPAGSGFQIPVSEWGVGTGVGDNAKFRMYKATKGAYFDYFHSTTGALRRIMLTDDGVDFSETVDGRVIYADQTIVEGVVQVFVDTGYPSAAKNKDVLVETDNPTSADGQVITTATVLTWADPECLTVTGTTQITLPNPSGNKNIDGTAVNHDGIVYFEIHNGNAANGIVTLIVASSGTINGVSTLAIWPRKTCRLRTGTGADWEVC